MNCDFYNLAPITIDSDNLYMCWSVWLSMLVDNATKLVLFDSWKMPTNRVSHDS